jgi:hypothetical protein
MAKRTEPPVMGLKEVVDKLRAAGFQVEWIAGNRVRVESGHCATVLEQDSKGIRFAEPPGYVVGGQIARLVDGGYQKFLATSKLVVPALAEHLKERHQFAGRMRDALGIPSLYNLSLGTVSDRYLYDRLAGRGDAPPPGVFGTHIRR